MVVLVLVAVVAVLLARRSFKATPEPSKFERVLGRMVRNYAIPSSQRNEKNPLQATPEILKDARERFIARCSICHGSDGRGLTQVGQNLYPRVPDFLSDQTQKLTDGELHYTLKTGSS